ncbi:hypothetical protein K1T71_010767 [Dendrolimus kikuchii]|uniref:Uncharacterized protein n=1 Tax=Dendrolimus kikuchii TaxID=765133 RepID=A0ACC1CPV6_9NEOP|nr:hypothetical protein K1T71_010767 [Dendrolimus kikuchii]
MRVTGSRVYARPAPVPKMPPGLELLMEGLTKQVLKNNPTDVYDFSAKHMLNLLEIRDGPAAKRSLTLEEKISKAQDRVRQRIKERCERYDQLSQSDEIKFALKYNEERDQIKTQQVLNGESVIHNEQNVRNSSEVDITASEMLFVDHEVNRINKEEHFNEKSFTENNNAFQNSLSDENLAKEFSEIHEGLAKGIIEITEDICEKIEDKSLSINPVNVQDQEFDNNTIQKESSNQCEPIDDNKDEIKSDMPPNSNVFVEIEVLNESEVNSVPQNTGCLNKFDSDTQLTLVQNDDSVIEKSDAPSDNKVDTDGKNVSVLNDCDKSIEERISVREGNTISCYVDLSNPYDKDIMECPKINSNELLAENSDPKIEKGIDCVQPLDNNIEIDDNLTKMNTNHKNPQIVNNANTKKDNFEVLFVEEKQAAALPDNLELVQEEQVENNHKIKVESFCNVVKHDENLNQNIYNSNKMNLESAAITIQKVFRNFLFKSRNSTYDDEANDDSNTLEETSETKEDSQYSLICANLNKERRPLGNMRMDTVLQTVNEEKSLSLSTDDSSTLSSAATIIQAHVRGFLVRNKLGSQKTYTNSLVNSNSPLSPSLENDIELQKSKTLLNIHIAPEADPFLSRDESMLVSVDLSLDGSPPTSINLHPLGYDKSERRKLKREDAVQSFSPPSNNSGKLSEDVDSVKENFKNDEPHSTVDNPTKTKKNLETGVFEIVSCENTPDEVLSEINNDNESNSSQTNTVINNAKRNDSLSTNSDETDVVTPFSVTPASTPTLLHTGEFHDVVLPTKVSRGDTSVVREFKTVLVYFLLWNNS